MRGKAGRGKGGRGGCLTGLTKGQRLTPVLLIKGVLGWFVEWAKSKGSGLGLFGLDLVLDYYNNKGPVWFLSSQGPYL